MRMKQPRMVFQVDLEGVVGNFHGETVCGSAGFYGRRWFVEIVQGVDLPTAIAYRWLRLGRVGKKHRAVLLAKWRP